MVASGEQVTAGLMAIVLSEMGIESRSFQGWQVPIHTDDAHGAARIVEIDPTELNKRMSEGWVPVITGFPGHCAVTAGSRRWAAAARTRRRWRLRRRSRRIAAISIPTSTASIRPTRGSTPRRKRLNKIAFEEMLEMASLGAKVLMIRSVEMAMAHKVRLVVRSTFDDPEAPQVAPGRNARRARHAGMR